MNTDVAANASVVVTGCNSGIGHAFAETLIKDVCLSSDTMGLPGLRGRKQSGSEMLTALGLLRLRSRCHSWREIESPSGQQLSNWQIRRHIRRVDMGVQSINTGSANRRTAQHCG